MICMMQGDINRREYVYHLIALNLLDSSKRQQQVILSFCFSFVAAIFHRAPSTYDRKQKGKKEKTSTRNLHTSISLGVTSIYKWKTDSYGNSVKTQGLHISRNDSYTLIFNSY